MDNGYDIADYFSIDPEFGCLSDFDHFIREAHRRDFKVIIDVVLNHVSTEHPWFKEGAANPASEYRDYFFSRMKPIIGSRFLVVLLGSRNLRANSFITINFQHNRRI